MDIRTLHTFEYKFDSGPLSQKDLAKKRIKQGNCRLAVQDYFYQIKKKYISEQDVLLPRGFKEVGTLIKEFTGENLSFEELLQGDILYAERVRNKEMKRIERGKEKFSTEDDWIISLHTAIFLGRMCQDDPVDYVWHATAICGGTVLWTIGKFLYYYKPVAAKRIH